MELIGKSREGAFWDDGNVLCLDLGGGYIGAYICQNSHLSAHFTICKINLNFKRFKMRDEI